MELLISLIAGAFGGNLAGGLLKGVNLGVFGNSIAGVIGGGAGSQILAFLGNAAIAKVAGGTDGGILIIQAAAGGVGGALVLVSVGLIRNLAIR